MDRTLDILFWDYQDNLQDKEKREVILTAYPHLNVLRWLLSFEINVDAHLFFLSRLVGPVITRQRWRILHVVLKLNGSY